MWVEIYFCITPKKSNYLSVSNRSKTKELFLSYHRSATNNDENLNVYKIPWEQLEQSFMIRGCKALTNFVFDASYIRCESIHLDKQETYLYVLTCVSILYITCICVICKIIAIVHKNFSQKDPKLNFRWLSLHKVRFPNVEDFTKLNFKLYSQTLQRPWNHPMWCRSVIW